MGMTMQIEVRQVCKRFVSADGSDLAEPHEAPQGLNDLNVHEVWDMKFIVVAEQASLDSCAGWRLEQKLQQGRSVDDDQADSRSSRMTTAAGVFKVTRFLPCSLASISSRVGRAARRSSSANR